MVIVPVRSNVVILPVVAPIVHVGGHSNVHNTCFIGNQANMTRSYDNHRAHRLSYGTNSRMKTVLITSRPVQTFF